MVPVTAWRIRVAQGNFKLSSLQINWWTTFIYSPTEALILRDDKHFLYILTLPAWSKVSI